jgi:hypothetical protein
VAGLNNESIRTAKKNVSRWFAGTDTRVFVPLWGRAIPVTAEEEQAIKAGAEPYIARSHERFTRHLVLQMVSVVVVVTLIYVAKDRYSALDNKGVDFLADFIVAMTALVKLYEGWCWERSIFDLRDGIALSLADRRGCPLVPDIDRGEPDYRKLGAIAFLLSGAIILWPMVSSTAASRNVAVSGDLVVGILSGAVIGILVFAALFLRRRSAAAAKDRTGG